MGFLGKVVRCRFRFSSRSRGESGSGVVEYAGGIAVIVAAAEFLHTARDQEAQHR